MFSFLLHIWENVKNVSKKRKQILRNQLKHSIHSRGDKGSLRYILMIMTDGRHLYPSLQVSELLTHTLSLCLCLIQEVAAQGAGEPHTSC